MPHGLNFRHLYCLLLQLLPLIQMFLLLLVDALLFRLLFHLLYRPQHRTRKPLHSRLQMQSLQSTSIQEVAVPQPIGVQSRPCMKSLFTQPQQLFHMSAQLLIAVAAGATVSLHQVQEDGVQRLQEVLEDGMPLHLVVPEDGTLLRLVVPEDGTLLRLARPVRLVRLHLVVLEDGTCRHLLCLQLVPEDGMHLQHPVHLHSTQASVSLGRLQLGLRLCQQPHQHRLAPQDSLGRRNDRIGPHFMNVCYLSYLVSLAFDKSKLPKLF